MKRSFQSFDWMLNGTELDSISLYCCTLLRNVSFHFFPSSVVAKFTIPHFLSADGQSLLNTVIQIQNKKRKYQILAKEPVHRPMYKIVYKRMQLLNNQGRVKKRRYARPPFKTDITSISFRFLIFTHK
jgi:hypothetical protein